MKHDRYPDDYLREILAATKSIVMLGASDDPQRPSHHVLEYLIGRDYRLFAVNPKLAGQSLLGVPVYARLADVPEPVDMVDVFRNNEAIPSVVDDVLALPKRPASIWMQLGVRVDEAAAKAEAAGLKVVMDRCPAIEIPRLF